MRSPYLRTALVWGAMWTIWLSIHALRLWRYGAGYTLRGHIQSALLATLLAVPIVVAAQRWLSGGTLADLGLSLSWREAAKPFVVGTLSFLVPCALGLMVVLHLGWSTLTPQTSPLEILTFLPWLFLLVFLYEALPEELAFRGYIYRTLAERHSRILAIVGQALLFGLWGTMLWTIRLGIFPIERLLIFVGAGLVFGLVRVITNSVWAPIGMHTAFQVIAQLLLNEERSYFIISGSETLQGVALGLFPFALATTCIGLAYRDKVRWRTPEARSEEARV